MNVVATNIVKKTEVIGYQKNTSEVTPVVTVNRPSSGIQKTAPGKCLRAWTCIII